MSLTADIDVLVSEVGPRDGLQSITQVMPTAAKKAWITAEAAAGVREIEVGSFVPAALLPQLADTAELVAHARSIPGLTVAALVPNFKGARAAVEAGAHKITLPLSASESHSLKNLRRTHAQVLDEAREQGGRLLALSVHPWVLGQPHRIKHLETVLAALAAEPEVWSAGPGEILDAFAAQA